MSQKHLEVVRKIIEAYTYNQNFKLIDVQAKDANSFIFEICFLKNINDPRNLDLINAPNLYTAATLLVNCVLVLWNNTFEEELNHHRIFITSSNEKFNTVINYGKNIIDKVTCQQVDEKRYEVIHHYFLENELATEIKFCLYHKRAVV